MAKQTTIALSDEALAILKGRYGGGFKTGQYMPNARFVDQGEVQRTKAIGEEDRVRTWRNGVVNAAKSQADEDVQLTLMLYDSPEGYRAKQAGLADEERRSARDQEAIDQERFTIAPPTDLVGRINAKLSLGLAEENVARHNAGLPVTESEWQAAFARNRGLLVQDAATGIWAYASHKAAEKTVAQRKRTDRRNARLVGEADDAALVPVRRILTDYLSQSVAGPAEPGPAEPDYVTQIRKMNWGG